MLRKKVVFSPHIEEYLIKYPNAERINDAEKLKIIFNKTQQKLLIIIPIIIFFLGAGIRFVIQFFGNSNLADYALGITMISFTLGFFVPMGGDSITMLRIVSKMTSAKALSKGLIFAFTPNLEKKWNDYRENKRKSREKYDSFGSRIRAWLTLDDIDKK